MVNNKAIRQAIYQRLNVSTITTSLANGSASLHHGVIPTSGSYPCVVFNKQAGTPTYAFQGSHFDSQLWLVKAVVRDGSSNAAEDIAKAVADRLDFASFNITGGDLMHIARDSDVDYTEVQGGQQFRHHGALYRIVVQ